jgi:hypothetical protein
MRPAPGSTHPSFRSRRGRSRSQQGAGCPRRGVTATRITGRRTVGIQLLKVQSCPPDPDTDAWILSSLIKTKDVKKSFNDILAFEHFHGGFTHAFSVLAYMKASESRIRIRASVCIRNRNTLPEKMEMVPDPSCIRTTGKKL